MQIPKKISSIYFRLKKYISCKILKKEENSGSLNQGVAKDFEGCVTALKVAVSHMIRDWASHFLMRDLVILQARRMIYQLDFLLINHLI